MAEIRDERPVMLTADAAVFSIDADGEQEADSLRYANDPYLNSTLYW